MVRTLAGKQTQVRYSSSATPLTVAYRTTDGALDVGEPTSGEHATTKTYVDAVKATADAALPASKIEVVSEMPDSPAEDIIYFVTGV